MASIEERLQIKREPLDKWSIREQLCLAVARNSDQNLTSVSRALKPFGEPNRPADWFHQKNCAAQYGALLANFETPKRKKRTSGAEVIIETPAEAILRKLLNERKAELKKLLAEEKAEYLKLQKDMVLLNSGNITEDQLDIWCKEIDEEEQKKEQEALAHDQWLREREQRKLEIERVWRPVKPTPVVAQKRKNSDSHESVPMDIEPTEEQKPPEPPKPALSPLLTSLLKSPSQVVNVTTSSILHSAITNQRPTSTNTNPTIASLLNSSTNVTVSPGLQQLVSSAIGQEPAGEESVTQDNNEPNDILDDPNLQILKIDDLASSILIQNGPLPEIKNDVDVIISDLMENAHDIVADPEQHLQIDVNGDINLNLELDDLEEADPEPESKENIKETVKDPYEKQIPSVDPFEFQDEPEVFEPKPSTSKAEFKQTIQEAIQSQPEQKIAEESALEPIQNVKAPPEDVVKTEVIDDEEALEKLSTPSSIDSEEKTQEEEQVKVETEKDVEKTVEILPVKEEEKADEEKESETKPEVESPVFEDTSKAETKKESTPPVEEEKKEEEQPEPSTSKETNDFNEELYDDINMEVKIDKSGKAKRDYSRTKKKEEKDQFDMLLGLDKPNESELVEESLSDYSEIEKKDTKSKIKSENDRSSSPWTEEEDISTIRTRRRLSTPATPIDSVPNSPVSSIFYYDDDREYKSWKKSVMMVYNRLAANKYASLFSKPITDDQAPGYHSIVFRPMDLLTIRKNIENGVIRTTQHFQRDVLLMLNNAIMYNKTNDTVFNMARQMQQESMQQIQILLQAQSSQSDVPARRETRTSEPGAKRKRGGGGGLEESTRSKKRKDD